MPAAASPCPECGKEAIAFRNHLMKVRDVDKFECCHCGTPLRRTPLAWVSVIFSLGVVLVSGSVALEWVTESLERNWLILPLFLVYALFALGVLAAGSFVNWRFLGVRRIRKREESRTG